MQIQLHTAGGLGHGDQASLPTVLLSVHEFRGSPARGSTNDPSKAGGPSCPQTTGLLGGLPVFWYMGLGTGFQTQAKKFTPRDSSQIPQLFLKLPTRTPSLGSACRGKHTDSE